MMESTWTNKFSIRLDSQGLCFICLRGTSPTSVDGPELISRNCIIRFRNIARFLRMDTKGILKTYLDYDLRNCSDVKVEVCQECSELIAKFNSLYQTFEVTKMKLNEVIGTISSLISDAEQDADRSGEMERRVTHGGTKRVIDSLRTGVFEKGSELLASSLPRVNVERLSADKLTSKVSALKCDLVKTEVLEESESTPSSPAPVDDFSSAPEESDQEAPSSTLEVKVKGSIRRESEKPSTASYEILDEKVVFCPHCASTQKEGEELRRHVVRYHCHQILKEHRLPSVTPEQFEELVSSELFERLITRDGERCSCTVCLKKYERRVWSITLPFSMRLHLLDSHYENLVEKLVELQRDPDIVKKLAPSQVKVSESVLTCPAADTEPDIAMKGKQICGTPSLWKVKKKKKKRVIPRGTTKPSSSSSGPVKGKEPRCPHCASTYKSQEVLEGHILKSHCEQYFSAHQVPSVTPELFQKLVSSHLFEGGLMGREGEKLWCTLCSKQFFYGKAKRDYHLKRHLIKKHFEVLVKKLMKLQKDPPKIIVEKQRPSESNERGTEVMSTLKKLSCPHCRAVIVGRNGRQEFYRHLVCHHLETFFVPEEQFRKASLTSNQFKQVVYHFLFEVNSGRPRPQNMLKCTYCSVTFKPNSKLEANLKLHLLKKHFPSLTQRLKDLQEEEELPEKLARITGGKTCKCGAYFVHARVQNAHFHKFCRLSKDKRPKSGNASSSAEAVSAESSEDPLASFFEHDKEPSNRRLCPHCGTLISTRRSKSMSEAFSHHLLTHHLETFFLPEEEFKEPSLTSHQFKQVLRHFLFEDFNKEGKAQDCPQCSKTLTRSRDKKPHLLKHHREFVDQKLKDLQKEPESLLRKLEMVRGFSCKCGAYFQHGKAYHSHLKKFCSLRSSTTTSGKKVTMRIRKMRRGNEKIKVEETDDGKQPLALKIEVDHDDPNESGGSDSGEFEIPAGRDEKAEQLAAIRDWTKRTESGIETTPERGSERFQSSFPRVEVERLSADLINSKVKSKPEISTDLVKSEVSEEYSESESPPASSPTPVDGLCSEPEPESGIPIESTSTSMFQTKGKRVVRRSTAKLSSSSSSSSDPIERKKFPCPHCPSSYGKPLNLQLHLVRCHCDQHFSEHRQPSVTSEQFQSIVSSSLFEGLIGMEGGKGWCTLCSKQFLYRRDYKFDLLKNHFIKKHYDLLVRKLMELQRNPPPSSMNLEKNKSESSKRSTLPCPHCRAVFVPNFTSNGRKDLYRHLVYHHLETFFVPEEEFREPCLTSFQFKQVVYHFLFEVNSGQSQKAPESCPYCSMTFRLCDHTTLYLKVHLLKTHFPLLAQRLRDLQQNTEVTEKLAKITGWQTCKCGAYFRNPNIHLAHSTKFCKLLKVKRDDSIKPKKSNVSLESGPGSSGPLDKGPPNSGGRSSCPHCSAVIFERDSKWNSMLIYEHRLRFHLETFFLPEEEFKEPSLTSHQFKKVVHLLFEEMRTPETAKECPHCNKTFSEKRDLIQWKLHWIKYHRDVVDQKLRELQKRPELLLQKLERIKGILCKCGAYFQAHFSYHCHLKKHCRLRKKTTSGKKLMSVTIRKRRSGGDDVKTEIEEDEGKQPLDLKVEIDHKLDDPEGSDSKETEIPAVSAVIAEQLMEVRDRRKRKGLGIETTLEEAGESESEHIPEKQIKLEEEWVE